MTPQVTALRCLWSLGYGGALGILYDFLRPLRPRRTMLADGVFSLAMLWAGICLGFGVCEGDLRVGYLAVVLAGGILWNWLLGRRMARYFAGFWKLAGKIWAFLLLPVKKSLLFAKKMFASGEKWVTIKWSNHRKRFHRRGGNPHGRIEEKTEKYTASRPDQSPGAEGPADRRYLIVYGDVGNSSAGA